MQALLQAVAVLRGPQVDPAELQARARLKSWQAARLAITHAQLLRSPRWEPAARFFLEELYAPRDPGTRDRDVARVLPKMERWLPRAALHTLVQALRMDVLSESLDADMALRLRARGLVQIEDDLDEGAYAQAYRDCGRLPERREQLELVERLGRSLDHLTRTPMIAASLKMMKKPAELAGLSELHAFLNRGFLAFAHMKGADEFLQRIVQEETQLMQRWIRP